MDWPLDAHTAARAEPGSSHRTAAVRAAGGASRALAAHGRARRERLPRPGAGDAARAAAEPGLLPPAVAPRRRARHRHPQLRRPAGQLLPPRPRSLRPRAGRQRHRAPPGPAAEPPAVRSSLPQGRGGPCRSCSSAPATALAHRWPRPSSRSARPVRSGRRARAADPRSACTPTPSACCATASTSTCPASDPGTWTTSPTSRSISSSPCATRRARSARTSPAPPDGCTGASRTPRRPTPRATRPSSAPRTTSTRASGTCCPSSPRHRTTRG